MIQSILVPFGGGASDAAVFESAIMIGRRLGAHLDFYHVNISAAEAAGSMPHADFAIGAALRQILADMRVQMEDRAVKARWHFDASCLSGNIPLIDTPGSFAGLSAAWIEDRNHAIDHMVARSRCRDLTIAARPRHGDRLPRDLLEFLVTGSGRPLLVLPDDLPLPPPETVMVCWNDTPECARAIAAALPFLKAAKRVVVVTVQETLHAGSGFSDVLRQLAWHGIAPEAISLSDKPDAVAGIISATAARIDADLVVMGAYGHTRTREFLFGGVTQAALSASPRGILLAH